MAASLRSQLHFPSLRSPRLNLRPDLGIVAVAALVLSFAQAPGRIAADTKLDLTANPIGFLTRATHLWTPTAPLGQVQNQAYGYFFPHGAFFALGEVLHLPDWITQRLWWALLLFIGFVGIVRLAEVLRIGSPGSRYIAATIFVLSPRVLTTLGSISSETLPMMLAPWVLIPVIRALDTRAQATDRPPIPLWRLAFQSAAAIALMGAVNAIATVAASAVAVAWFLMHRPSRRWLTFGGWWVVGGGLACAWWLVPLVLLSRVSPPFLDFIESSRVTTEWTSLTEVLRGTSSWTPFVSPERVAGSILVTQPAAVLATGILMAAGFAGLAMRHMPFRRRLIALAMLGVLLMCVGFVGALGSPIAESVRVFLDGAGAPLRNVHKLDPLVRIPAVLGIAHLLAHAPLRVSRESLAALAHPQRSKVTAATIVILVALIGAGSVAWTGGLAGSDTYRALPNYWRQTAHWLDHQARTVSPQSPGRALVVPGSPFAQQLWGLTRDEPLQPLASTPWAVRDAIPLVPPEAIRALDSVQRAIADGRGSPGLAPTLAQQGVSFVVLRADLTPIESRSARPLLARQALVNSPHIRKVAEFGPLVGPATVDGVVVDDGLRPKMPAVTIFAVEAVNGFPGTGPTLTDLDSMPQISGAPESLAALQDYRGRRGLAPLGPTLFDADATRAGVPTSALTVTDSPMDRETDFGRVDDHNSSVRAANDPRRTKNAAADYPVDGQRLVTGQWLLDNEPGHVSVSASQSASDATQPGQTSPADSPAAAFDNNTETSWISGGLESAVGQWLQLTFDRPRANLSLTITTHKAIGPDVTGIAVETDSGTAVAQGIKPGDPVVIALPGGATHSVRIRALSVDGGVAGNQFALSEVAVRDLASDRPLAIRFRPQLPDLPVGTDVARWLLAQELDTRSACVQADATVRCSPALGRSAETPGVFSRMLSVPKPTPLVPTVVLRPKPGTDLNAALALPGTLTATGPAAVSDSRGNAMALVDGDVATTWVAPDGRSSKDRPTVVLTLPAPQRVDRLVLAAPSDYVAHPTEVSVDTGAGPTTHRVDRDGTVTLDGSVTQRVSLTIRKWSDLIDVNGLGFARSARPGISEISVLPAPPAAASPDRRIEVDCSRGVGLTLAGQVVRLHVSTTARALTQGQPVVAQRCDDAPVNVPAGRQEVSVNPTGMFTVASVDLATPQAADIPAAGSEPTVDTWTAAHRSVRLDASSKTRVLTVPESINPGWRARIGDRVLTPITVNGWQQGWVVPAGSAGTAQLTYRFDTLYRWSLAIGLAAVALLLILAFWPRRRGPEVVAEVGAVQDDPGSPPSKVQLTAGGLGICAGAWLLAGWWGLGTAIVVGGAGTMLQRRHSRIGSTLPAVVFGLLITATLYLASGPWQSSTGYHGFDWPAQLFALLAIEVLVWSACLVGSGRSRPRNQSRSGSSTNA